MNLCIAGLEGFDCSIGIGVMILLFFVAAILRKQVGDLLNISYNMIAGTIAGEAAYLIILFIFHRLKYAFLGGLLAVVIVGFIAGQLIESGGDDD